MRRPRAVPLCLRCTKKINLCAAVIVRALAGERYLPFAYYPATVIRIIIQVLIKKHPHLVWITCLAVREAGLELEH